jgi:GT2 family glycosyltransferase
MKRVGLVTVTYNSAAVIDGFLESLRAQDFPEWRLYVVDNASRDDGLDRIRRDLQDDERLAIIANSDNRGVATANNQGIKAALADGCDGVLLINNDIEFGPDLLSGMIAAMDRLDADILVPKIYYFEPKNMIWCAGGWFKRTRAYMTMHFGENEIDRGQYDEPMRIEYAPTCCMLVRAAVFARIGLMDENYFVYVDDVDFCYRAMRAGLRFWYSPAPVIYHKVSSLTGFHSDFSIYNGTLGHTYFLRKHKPATKLFWLAVIQAKFLIRLLRSGPVPAAFKRFGVEQRGFAAGMRRAVSPR